VKEQPQNGARLARFRPFAGQLPARHRAPPSFNLRGFAVGGRAHAWPLFNKHPFVEKAPGIGHNPRMEDDRDDEADAPDAQPGATLSILAPPPEAGGVERVDAMLAKALPDLSRARIQGLIGAGQVWAAGAPVKAASDKARPGVAYTVTLPPPAPATPQPEAIALTIVFEDEHLLVIDKAAGMAMHPAPGSMTGTLVNAVLAHCGQTLSGVGGVARPGIVHRIDKDTTGLVVVAKHDAAHRGLAALFAKHRIERAYFALTRGAPANRSATLETMLARSGDDRRKMAVGANPERGKHAITRYWTIETFGALAGQGLLRPAAAYLECRLETGRTHQIRAHMAHLGCPIIGDPLYGKQRAFKLEGTGPAADAARVAVESFSRQALHAAVLGFVHPITQADLRFESAPPGDMQALLAALRRI
jgi:23S rRNA pseudouridine1911/1915/1917 synthase